MSFLNKEKGGSEGGMPYFSICSVLHFKLFAHQINSHQWFSIPGCGVHRWASEEWRRVCSGGKQLLICSSIEINTTTMLSAICVYNVSARRVPAVVIQVFDNVCVFSGDKWQVRLQPPKPAGFEAGQIHAPITRDVQYSRPYCQLLQKY